MTIEIKGRGSYRHSPAIEIYESDNGWHGEPVYRVIGGEIQTYENRNAFRITSRHENGTDVEHDPAFVFELEGAGLNWDRLVGPRVMFQGVMLKIRHYPVDFKIADGADLKKLGTVNDDITDKIYTCEDTEYYHPATQSEWPAGHLMMPYLPPRVKVKPCPIYIVANFTPQKEGS
jgi:hypothetical protein